MDMDLWITLVGLVVAGMAAVLGIWVERDATKPPRYAYALSILIIMATFVGMFQCYTDAKQGEKLEADMARMLQMLDKISNESGVEIPELDAFVKTEIAAQSRANPDVVAKLAQRVADEGGDPQEMLAKHLPASEVEGLQRKGELSVKPATVKPKIALTPKAGGEGDGAKKPMSLLRKKGEGDESAEGETAAAAPSGEAEAGEAKDLPEIKPKLDMGMGIKGPKPSLGAKTDAEAKDAPAAKPKMGAPKADAPKAATPKVSPKPKL